MKKKLLRLLSLLCCFCLLSGSVMVFPAAAEETAAPEPKISISGHNLALEDSIYMIYYVKTENLPKGATFGVLVWNGVQSEYVFGKEEFKAEYICPQEISGKTYEKFYLRGIAAKQMTDDFYAVPYIKNGNEITYGKLDKYSVLRYAYNQLGRNGTAGGSKELKELLTDLLDYGASSQKYFGSYHTERLATDNYALIGVEGGVLFDGMKEGLFKVGEDVALQADTVEGKVFFYWVNSLGQKVGTSPAITVKASENETFTAIFREEIGDLQIISNGDGTAYVAGIDPSVDTEIVIPLCSPSGDLITSIAPSAFSGSLVTGIFFDGESQCTQIGEEAFSDCQSLVEVILPEGLTEIPYGLFYNCSALENVTISSTVTAVGESAFSLCAALTDITIPGNVETIGANAFSDCGELQNVILEDGVQIIGEYAFDGCEKLKNIQVYDSLTQIGTGAFQNNTSLTKIDFYGLERKWKAVEKESDWNKGTGSYQVIFHETFSEGLKFTSKGDGTCSVSRGTCTDSEIVIPERSPANDLVTSIASSGFSGKTFIKSVTLPHSIASIGSNAFSSCTGLKEIYFDGTKAEWEAVSKGSSWNFAVSYFDVIYEAETKYPGQNGIGTLQGQFDCGDGSYVLYLTGVQKIGYQRYVGFLQKNGCTLVESYTLGDNIDKQNEYTLLQHEKYTVYCSYLPLKNAMRVYVGKAGEIAPQKTLSSPAANTVSPKFWSLEVDNSVDNGGMSYVFKLQDGTFIVIDGGYETKKEADNLYKILKDNTPAGQKPVIRAWFITHLHIDHYGAMRAMVDNHLNDVVVEAFYYNFPYVNIGDIWPSNAENVTAKMGAWSSAVKYNKMHSGMSFELPGALIEILCTYEDLYPSSTTNGNETSMVFTVTIAGQRFLFLGDAVTVESALLEETIPEDVLKCDIVQVSHHGYEGCSVNLYQKTGAKVLLWPMNVVPKGGGVYRTTGGVTYESVIEYWSKKEVEASQYLWSSEDFKEIILAGMGTQQINLPYTLPTKRSRPDYNALYTSRTGRTAK